MRDRRAPFLVLASALMPALLAACGADHDDASHTSGRVIDVTMLDNSFQPDQLRVSEGETITFRFTNDGAAVHEAVIGDETYQEAHHADMSSTAGDTAMDTGTMPTGSGTSAGDEHGGDDGHDDANAVTVAPGETAEITYTFDERGTVLIGCHEPGHWEAGMKATITVT